MAAVATRRGRKGHARIAPSNRAMAEVLFKGGWFCDRLAVSGVVADNLTVAGPGWVEVLQESGLQLDFVEPEGRRGRNQGLIGTWQRQAWANGGKGEPGRVFMRCTEVGYGPEGTASVYAELNPVAAPVDVLAGVGRLFTLVGADVDSLTVHRFDATLDVFGAADEFVIDDRTRKWKCYGAGTRETQVVGDGGPLRGMLYDKSTQLREKQGVELGHDVTRFEFCVRPGATVDADDVYGKRLRVPEDRRLGGLCDWPFPAPRTKLRRVDPLGCSDWGMRGWLLAARCMGVRAALASMRDCTSPAVVRDFVECLPLVNVEGLWSSSWSSSVRLLVAALKGDVYGACSERRAA